MTRSSVGISRTRTSSAACKRHCTRRSIRPKSSHSAVAVTEPQNWTTPLIKQTSTANDKRNQKIGNVPSALDLTMPGSSSKAGEVRSLMVGAEPETGDTTNFSRSGAANYCFSTMGCASRFRPACFTRFAGVGPLFGACKVHCQARTPRSFYQVIPGLTESKSLSAQAAV